MIHNYAPYPCRSVLFDASNDRQTSILSLAAVVICLKYASCSTADLNPSNNNVYDLGSPTVSWASLSVVSITSSMTNVTMGKPIDMNTQKIIDLANPTLNQDAATKYYVDNYGGWSGSATSNLDMNDYDIVDADTIQATSGQSLTLKVTSGQSIVFQAV